MACRESRTLPGAPSIWVFQAVGLALAVLLQGFQAPQQGAQIADRGWRRLPGLGVALMAVKGQNPPVVSIVLGLDAMASW